MGNTGPAEFPAEAVVMLVLLGIFLLGFIVVAFGAQESAPVGEDMSNALLLMVGLFGMLATVAFCYGYWHSRPEKVENRERYNEYQIQYHYQDGKWH